MEYICYLMSFIKKCHEITFELTDFCEEGCEYCSSNAISDIKYATFLNIEIIEKALYDQTFERIHLSGGEPLAHPNFYQILRLCQEHTEDVVVHTNLLKHIIFNGNVIDNIYIEENLSVSSDVDKVNILKRIEQGKERKRPEVHFSGNWTHECNDCDQPIIRADGVMVKSPCKKDDPLKDAVEIAREITYKMKKSLQ